MKRTGHVPIRKITMPMLALARIAFHSTVKESRIFVVQSTRRMAELMESPSTIAVMVAAANNPPGGMNVKYKTIERSAMAMYPQSIFVAAERQRLRWKKRLPIKINAVGRMRMLSTVPDAIKSSPATKRMIGVRGECRRQSWEPQSWP